MIAKKMSLMMHEKSGDSVWILRNRDSIKAKRVISSDLFLDVDGSDDILRSILGQKIHFRKLRVVSYD